MRFAHWFVMVAGAAVGISIAAVGCGGDDTTTAPPGADTCDPKPECTTVKSECEALFDNSTGDTASLRFSQLTVTGPEQLATGAVASTIATGVLLKSPACNLAGQGTFSWLMQFTKSTGDLVTGGAPPSTPKDGYCFVNGKLGTTDVAPLENKGVLKDGKFKSAMGENVVVPIYLDATGEQYVLLPLRQATMEGTLSSDFNCVGSYNAKALSTKDSCQKTADVPLFVNGGKLEGYITLEDSDQVDVALLSQSLCVLLSGDPAKYGDAGMPIERCKRDMGTPPKILLEGDWCSTTNSAGGCKDSYKLTAEFAASGVKINGNCP